MMNVMDLFNRGYDTAQIAGLTQRPESDVYNELSRARDEARRWDRNEYAREYYRANHSKAPA